jgi:hypothetical protein
MTDQELRAMIRDSIARHAGGEAGGGDVVRLATLRSSEGNVDRSDGAVQSAAAFLRLPLPSGDAEGACLIEPAVRCTHCGYCLSLGH